MVMPVRASVMPSPSISAEEPQFEACTKIKSGAVDEESWIRIPSRPDCYRTPIHEPRIVFREVNDFRIYGLNNDGLILIRYSFLRGRFQVSCVRRFLAHYLDGVHQVLLLVEICVAQGR